MAKKRIPYDYMTSEKWNSLGKKMTLKQALDMWWNSVRVRNKKTISTCYKCSDGDYIIDNDYATEKQLNRTVVLDESYEYDADGYPIVFATMRGTL